MEHKETSFAGHPDNWYGKPYYSLDAYCKNTYGEKLYKIAFNAGLTCPNRDGTLGSRGCIFCSAGGSGDFAAAFTADTDAFQSAYRESLARLSGKSVGQKYIAYFQAYTNTYGPLSYLERIYRLALGEPTVAGISIATRPDCLPEPVLSLLARLREEYAPKFIWIELGLQTIHASSADFIRRGYPLSVFEDAAVRLSKAEIPVVTHLILGLPGETRDDILASIDYLNRRNIWGIKLQLLHILKGTDLAFYYEKDPQYYGSFETLEDYLDTLTACLAALRPDMVIHRLTGDAPRPLLLAPAWSIKKRLVLNTLHKRMKELNIRQGTDYVYRKD